MPADGIDPKQSCNPRAGIHCGFRIDIVEAYLAAVLAEKHMPRTLRSKKLPPSHCIWRRRSQMIARLITGAKTAKSKPNFSPNRSKTLFQGNPRGRRKTPASGSRSTPNSPKVPTRNKKSAAPQEMSRTQNMRLNTLCTSAPCFKESGFGALVQDRHQRMRMQCQSSAQAPCPIYRMQLDALDWRLRRYAPRLARVDLDNHFRPLQIHAGCCRQV